MAWLAPWLTLAVSAVGFILRTYQLGSKGLWLDEAFSVWLGWQPLPELMAWLVKVDQHPPLYYTLLHFWMALGDSAATVRAFSALTGTLTIPVIYLLGRRLAGPVVGVLAACILALAPFHVHFAQESRMYTLLTLNASLAMLMLARLLTDARAATLPVGRQLEEFYHTWRRAGQAPSQEDTPPRGSTVRVIAPAQRQRLSLQEIETDLAWIGYMVFTAATALTHNTAIFFPMAANLFVLGLILIARRKASGLASPPSASHVLTTLRPPSLRNWLIAQAGIFLLWSPWLVPFVIQAAGVYREFWIPKPTLGTVLGTVASFLSAHLPSYAPWSEVIWALYGLVTLLGVLHFRRRPATLALLLTFFLTPFVGEWLVSLRRPIFYDRTLIWATIPLYLLLAAGIGQLRHLPYVLVALAIMATVNGISLHEYYVHFEKEQWREAAAYVAQRVGDEDLILFNATWVQIPFDFYFRHFNHHVAEHGVPVDLFDRGTLEPQMTRDDLPRLRELIRGRERVWLVYSHNWYTDPQALIPVALSEQLNLLEKRDFFGLEVHLYGVPGS